MFNSARWLALSAALALAPACREGAAPSNAAAPAPSPASTSASTPASTPSSKVGRGIIEGKVHLTGTPPPPSFLATSAMVSSVCGEQVPDGSLSVGASGALANVVVSVARGAALPDADRPSPATTLDQRKCAYVPAVAAARAGTSLEVRNSDPLVHNVRAMDGANAVFNVAMPLEGMTLKKPLPAAPATVNIRCDLHPWMRAVVRTFDHPYFTTTDGEGVFRLEVPEGTHTLLLWHPRLSEATLEEVTVKAGQTVRVEHAWAAADVR